MGDRRADAVAILARLESGALSPSVALMEMLISTEDEALVTELVRAAAASSPRAAEVAELCATNAGGCAQVAAMLRSGVDSPPVNATIEEGIAFCRTLFDWSVRQSEEASVALYSLGSPGLLRAATAEIVAQLEEWGSLGEEIRALDVGCGIGRMEEALAPRLGDIHGIDVSDEMIATARRRCAGIPNASFSACTGRDLAPFADASFDLVFAIDSFPYLVQSGLPLVATHFAEARRVLRHGGELVILNFSYREEPDADRATVSRLAGEYGFEVLVAGSAPFAIWNGTAFRMKRRD